MAARKTVKRRTIELVLTRERRPIGRVRWSVWHEASAEGRVLSVEVDDDPELAALIDLWLTTNPEALSIVGGHIPTKIGRYAEGVASVLEVLSEREGFSFDARALPFPKVAIGAMH